MEKQHFILLTGVYIMSLLFNLASNINVKNAMAIRQGLFDNKIMTTYLIQRYDSAISIAWCAITCYTEPKCGSFFYNRNQTVCQLHSVLFVTPADAQNEQGTTYFKISEAWCPVSDGFILHRSPVLCYKVHLGSQDYGQAKLSCQQDGATLLKVKDEHIAFHMFEFLRASTDLKSNHYTVGADDLDVQGQYKWVDGDIATWTNWASGEPSDPNERCLAIAWFYYFEWNDIPCSHPNNFICEIDTE